MSAAALVAQLAAAGTPPDLLAAVAQELFSAEAERRILSERRENERARKAKSRGVTGQNVTACDETGPLNDIYSKPVDSPIEASASTTPRRRKERGTPIPPDWTPPPIAELSERAKACASQWPAGRYETEAEGYVAFWINDGRCRPSWRLTWITRIIQIHSQVMRDARFAPVGAPNGHRKPRTEQDIKNGIKRAEDNNDPDRAAELVAELAALQANPSAPTTRPKSTGPPGQSIGAIVQRAGLSH